MKYRNPGALTTRITTEWLQKSEELLNRLLAATPEEKKKIISENSGHWSAIKKDLANFSKDKCWYSERKLTETEMEVDHFRPKGKVEGIEHSGYWWLAFDYRNFRLSSSTVNKKRKNTFSSDSDDVFGKGTLFPLENETSRVVDPQVKIDHHTLQLGGEQPFLLDPLVNGDNLYLDFNFQEGLVIEAVDLQDGQVEKLRARMSIDIYYLNSSVLLQMRQQIAKNLNNLLSDVKELVQKKNENPDEFTPTKIRSKFKLIVDMVAEDAEFSSFSKSFLASRRHEFPELIDKVMTTT